MNGIERIKVLSSEISNKPLLKIVDYLLTRNDMNDKYLNEDKTLKQMIEFIKNMAKEKTSDGCAMIEDEVVYGWAIHYWDEPNEKLKLENVDKKEETKKSKKEETKHKTTSKKVWYPEGQLTLFDMM